MKELTIRFLDFFGLACWLEIITEKPKCIYYFGPFLDKKDAQNYLDGYIEDLENEAAEGITFQFKRLKPKVLTIDFEEDDYQKKMESIPNLTRQYF